MDRALGEPTHGGWVGEWANSLIANRRFGVSNIYPYFRRSRNFILFRFYRHVKPFSTITIHTEQSDMCAASPKPVILRP